MERIIPRLSTTLGLNVPNYLKLPTLSQRISTEDNISEIAPLKIHSAHFVCSVKHTDILTMFESWVDGIAAAKVAVMGDVIKVK